MSVRRGASRRVALCDLPLLWHPWCSRGWGCAVLPLNRRFFGVPKPIPLKGGMALECVVFLAGEGGNADASSSRSLGDQALSEKRSIVIPKLRSIGGVSQTRYHAKQTPRGNRSARAAVVGDSFPRPIVQVRSSSSASTASTASCTAQLTSLHENN